MSIVSLRLSSVLPASVRTLVHDDVEYVIVPVIAMVGNAIVCPVSSGENELVTAEVLAHNAAYWDGFPVLLDHPGPLTPNYGHLSATSPEGLSQTFGVIRNARFEDGKLKMDAWLNKELAREVPGAEDLIERCLAGDVVEISIGAEVRVVLSPGTFGGRSYDTKWLSIIPNHLAMLPANREGACSVEMGCGGPRLLTTSAASLVTGIASLAITAARRPTYNGTESIPWSAPSFGDYIKGLHNGSDAPPSSIADASLALKSAISARTLLGDPTATSFRDVCRFPVVDPRNDKLNEKALRAIVGSYGTNAEIAQGLKTSAQDMARMLLKSEFDVEMTETITSNSDSPVLETPTMPKPSAIARMMESVRNSVVARNMARPSTTGTSYNDIMDLLSDMIRESEPTFLYVSDVFPDTSTVVYCVWTSGDDPTRYYQRTYELDADKVKITSDRQEVAIQISYEPVTSATAATVATPATATVATAIPTAASCGCGTAQAATATSATNASHVTTAPAIPAPDTAHISGGTITMDRPAVIQRLITSASAPFAEAQRSVLEAMPDPQLAALDAAFPAVALAQALTTAAPTQATATAPGTPGAISPLSFEEFMAVAPAAIREDYELVHRHATRVRAQEQTARTRLLAALSKLPSVARVYTPEVLATRTLDQLQEISQLVGGADDSTLRRDYSALAPMSDPALDTTAEDVPKPPRPYTAALAARKAQMAGGTVTPPTTGTNLSQMAH